MDNIPESLQSEPTTSKPVESDLKNIVNKIMPLHHEDLKLIGGGSENTTFVPPISGAPPTESG